MKNKDVNYQAETIFLGEIPKYTSIDQAEIEQMISDKISYIKVYISENDISEAQKNAKIIEQLSIF